LIGLDGEDLPHQHDRAGWPVLRERFAAVFKTRTRDEWTDVFVPSDACVAPVLSMTEAAEHPYNTARDVFPDLAGHRQPAPAPRFSR
ncbi:CoA transferase, partial [Micromonospora aurantiaca]|nr:CoA transferase [Micromonospora aurantiaca]